MRTIQIERGGEYQTKFSDIYDSSEFYYDEYCQAAACIHRIVKRSDDYREHWGKQPQRQSDPFDLQERALRGYVKNVVAFCANRGHGKTSAMLSMAKALYDLPEDGAWEERDSLSDERKRQIVDFWEVAKKRVGPADSNRDVRRVDQHSFFVLPPVDPTTMEQNSSILLHILSSLFRYFEQREEARFQRQEDRQTERLIEKFQEAYHSICEMNLSIDKLEEDVERLADYGDGRRIQRRFAEVVEAFLQYVHRDMLVVQIDDADLNTTRAFEIVEGIRKYCVAPGVLVLMAVHRDTLLRCIERQYVIDYNPLLSNGIAATKLDPDRCHEMAVRYVDKLIPTTNQVYLPYINKLFMENPQNIGLYYYDEKHRDLLAASKTGGGVGACNYESKLFYMVYIKTGVALMPHREYLHNLLPRRMRELTHFLAMLDSMESLDLQTEKGKDTYASLIRTTNMANKKKRLELRTNNLNRLENYLIEEWCAANLNAEQQTIVKNIREAATSEKHGVTESELRTYIKQVAGEEAPPAQLKNASYGAVMRLVLFLQNKCYFKNHYELAYAICMYYSIFLNKLVCKCLNDAAFNSTELEHFTGRQLLVGRNIDQQTRAQLQYELSRKLLDKIGTPSQEVCRILPELENSKDEFIQVDIGLPMFSRMLFEPIPQAHMVLERQYERKIAHRSIGSLDLDARSVRSVQTALLLTANCDVQEFVDRCAVTVDVGDKEVINMKYPQAWYAAIQNLLSPKKSGEAVPQQLPLHWLCENTFGDELTNLQRILCADPIQLLGTLQKCLAAFVEPQRDTATSNIAGYMDVLGQFPAFSKLKQAFDTFQKAAVDGTEAELPKLRKPLEDAAKEYEARKRVTVGADGEAVQQEIAPADKIEQVLQNKSLTREQKATLVKFALDENGFLSDKFLSTKF